MIEDYFFSPYIPPQQRRRSYVMLNGVQHASEITPRDPAPGEAVTLHIATNPAANITHVGVYYTVDGSLPEGMCGEATHGTTILATAGATVEADGVAVQRWQAQIPSQPDGTLVRYRLDGWDDANQRWPADALDYVGPPAPQGREFAYHVDQRRMPEWAKDLIIYQVFVDRFAAASDQPPLRDPGDIMGFYGGTLRGVTEKLDYIARLGVTCLWLSPIMESPSYHGYDPSSYLEVAKRYGTNDDLRDLIRAAHARGLRVLLDFVANHTSNEHPAFIAARGDPTDPYADWYTFDAAYQNGYLTYYEVPGMPVLTTDAAPVRAYLAEAARHWLHDFGADGLRLDNVSGPTHAFWTFFQEAIKASAPDALTLGEVTGGMDDIVTYAGRLDAVMDFPLTKALRRTLAQRVASLDELLTHLLQHEAEFPATLGQACILDNHDMHRFLYLAEGDTRRLKLALTLLLTLPGMPVIYYGTEVGLSQHDGPRGQDSYAREPMPWGDAQQADVYELARWLVGLRRDRASLRRGTLARVPVTVETEEASQVGALVRRYADETTLLVLNNSAFPATFALATEHLPTMPPTATWLVTPAGITAMSSSFVENLPGFSAVLYLW